MATVMEFEDHSKQEIIKQHVLHVGLSLWRQGHGRG